MKNYNFTNCRHRFLSYTKYNLLSKTKNIQWYLLKLEQAKNLIILQKRAGFSETANIFVKTFIMLC